MGVIEAFGGTVLLLVAGGCLYAGARGGKRYLAFRRVTEREGSDVEDGELVGLEGEVAETGGLVSPLSETECVAYTWELEEWKRSGESENWRSQHAAAETERFRLKTADGTTVTVDPPEDLDPYGDVHLGQREVFRVPPDEEPPEPVQRLVDRGVIEANEETLGSQLDRGPGTGPVRLGTRRFRELALAAGDSVHVYGRAERTGGDVTVTAGDLFVLSGKEKFSLQRNTLWASVLVGILGVTALYFAALLLV